MVVGEFVCTGSIHPFSFTALPFPILQDIRYPFSGSAEGSTRGHTGIEPSSHAGVCLRVWTWLLWPLGSLSSLPTPPSTHTHIDFKVVLKNCCWKTSMKWKSSSMNRERISWPKTSLTVSDPRIWTTATSLTRALEASRRSRSPIRSTETSQRHFWRSLDFRAASRKFQMLPAVPGCHRFALAPDSPICQPFLRRRPRLAFQQGPSATTQLQVFR